LFHFPNDIGVPDNPEYMDEDVFLRGEEINNTIIGKVVWWRGLKK
jgi:phage repressor protein C with HTH and peptisase S24 domain